MNTEQKEKIEPRVIWQEAIWFIGGVFIFIWACFAPELIGRSVLAVIASIFALYSIYKNLKRKKNKSEELEILTTMMLCIIAIIFIGIVTLYIGEFRHIEQFSPEGFGQFGDLIGGILNPIVAICALVALLKGTKLQHDELKLSREETKRAQESEKKVLEQQQRQYSQQRFFDWMNLYRDSLEQIGGKNDISNLFLRFNITYMLSSDNTKKGTYDLYTLLDINHDEKSDIKNFIINFKYMDDDVYIDKNSLKNDWNQFFKHCSILSIYFRIIFNFLTYANSDFGKDAKRMVKVFRAQLTEREILLLSVNLLFNEQGKEMIPLVKKFSLLKHLPEQYQWLRELIICHIGADCFGIDELNEKNYLDTKE